MKVRPGMGRDENEQQMLCRLNFLATAPSNTQYSTFLMESSESP